jgi:hypothetical protein
MNVKWYINRLKTMSVSEILFRAEQLSYRKYSKWRFTGFKPSVKLEQLPKPILDIDTKIYNNLKLEGTEFDILGLKWDYSKTHNWHQDIRTGGIFPKIPSRSVNTRTDEFGIAKYVWEPNRHQFLTRICYQFRATGDEKYLRLFMSHLSDWQKSNPYLIGVNWYSNIEVNTRLITWFLCWEILDLSNLYSKNEEVKTFVSSCFTPLIYLHCKFAHDYPSRFSSANNHRIAEGVGLFIASEYWRFPESKTWNASARRIVEEEIVAQHTPDGINREETSEYIQFITDFFLIANVVANCVRKPFSETYNVQLRSIMKYISQLLDVKGGINHYGDADNGRTFILEATPSHFNNFKSLLVSGSTMFKDNSLRAFAGDWDLKNEILFGVKGREVFSNLKNEHVNRTSQFYEEQGRYLFRKEKAGQEILLNFDAAPLGFLAIAAHGHADALSFSLTVDGYPVLVDCGTYSYHTDMKWRDYFKGTRAHNTINVDGMNQAKIGGPTMWKSHYICETTEVIKTELTESVSAKHNGYVELGVEHSRNVVFSKAQNCFDVIDSISSKDKEGHTFEFPLHLHPEIIVEQKESKQLLLTREGMRNVLLTLDKDYEIEMINGSEDPILGWFSEDFYVKTPCYTILQRKSAVGGFVSKITIQVQE